MADRAPDSLDRLTEQIVSCRACPRLVAWREQVGVDKRAAFRDEHYWARPVPGFGDPSARVVIVGLAPAAHGANRTGRMFTGRSQRRFPVRLAVAHRLCEPTDERALVTTGCVLRDAYITAPVRCAPPANKPTPAERDQCRPFLQRELALLASARVLVALGQFAYQVAGHRPRRSAPPAVRARARGQPVVRDLASASKRCCARTT